MAGAKTNRYPGVYRRGKVWAFRAQFDDENGRWGVSGSGFPSAKQAADARQQAIDNARPTRARGGRAGDPNITLAEWVQRWAEDRAQTVRPGSAVTYRSRAKLIAQHPLASRRLRQLTESDYRKLIGDLGRAGNAGRGHNHGGLMAKVNLLRSALHAAVRAGVILENPVAGIHVSRTQESYEAQTWTLEEIQRFLAHRKAAEDPLYPAYHLAVATGLRRGELHGIRREDVDLDAGLIHIRRQRTSVPGVGIVEGPPKTSTSEAPVYIDPETVRILREHEWSASGYLVVDPRTGAPYRFMQDFLLEWKRACRSAGVPVIRFHEVRHTAATMMAHAGVPILLAQQRLRHWSSTMTKRYMHIQDSSGKAVADLLGRLLAGEPEDPAA